MPPLDYSRLMSPLRDIDTLFRRFHCHAMIFATYADAYADSRRRRRCR